VLELMLRVQSRVHSASVSFSSCSLSLSLSLSGVIIFGVFAYDVLADQSFKQ
jgi:hypothetical protein